MTQLILNQLPDNMPIRLTAHELLDPLPVIEILCEEYTIGQIRDRLWELVEIALSEDGLYNDPIKRADLLCWHKRVERALESAYILNVLCAPPTIENEAPETDN